MAPTLGINNRVNEILWIVVELKITSQAVEFIKRILSFLAGGEDSVMKTLNQTSFHMRRIVKFDVEISVSIGGFSLNFDGQYRPFPDDPDRLQTFLSHLNSLRPSIQFTMEIESGGAIAFLDDQVCACFITFLLYTFSVISL
jgi:hypothetical protein